MAIILTQAEKDLLTAIGADSADAFTSGISVDTNGDGVADQTVYTDVMPIKDWAQLAPTDSEFDIKMRNGTSAGMAPIVRRLGPIGFQASRMGPITAFTGTASILTYTLRLPVARTIQITANFTCSSSVFGTTPTNLTRVDYWLEINGVPTTAYRLVLPPPVPDATYSFLPVSAMVTGTWTVILPAGAVTIDLKGSRGSGTGIISIGGHDFAALSAIG